MKWKQTLQKLNDLVFNDFVFMSSLHLLDID
jgi:hypothetical protein